MDELSRALKLYLGRPASPFPCSQPEDVREAFGDSMLDQVSGLLNDIRVLDVDWSAHTLVSAMDWAEEEMRRRHPNLEKETIADLGWAFSYWNK